MIKIANTPNNLGVEVIGSQIEMIEIQFNLYQLCDIIDSLRPKPKNTFAISNFIYSISYDARKASYSPSTDNAIEHSFKITWPRALALQAITTMFFRKIIKRDKNLAEFLNFLTSSVCNVLDGMSNDKNEIAASWMFLVNPPRRPLERIVMDHPGFDAYVNTLEYHYVDTPVNDRLKLISFLAPQFFLSTPSNDKIFADMETYINTHGCTYDQLTFANSFYQNWKW